MTTEKQMDILYKALESAQESLVKTEKDKDLYKFLYDTKKKEFDNLQDKNDRLEEAYGKLVEILETKTKEDIATLAIKMKAENEQGGYEDAF